MSKYLIKKGRVVDPATKTDAVMDILISSGKIEKTGQNIAANGAAIIDVSGSIVAPGFIDMHVHLREPGREDKETIRTGTRAAIHGGFTGVACMPNTEPAIDCPEMVKAVRDIAKKEGVCNVFIIGAITKTRGGKILSDIKGMKAEGIVAISDDGSSVEDARIMSAGLKEAKKEGVVLIAHCEDADLAAKGVVNRGLISTKMGLRGISKESEYERVRRDMELAKEVNAAIHIAHVSCMESVEAIRKAKRAGVKVTAETCPHYLALTEDCCVTYDTNTKMNPPLRTKDDVNAIKAGLQDGTIDVIATDHAPHTDCEKDVEFDLAPFGIIGLETALGLAVTELIDGKVLTWPELIAKLSLNPARILGINSAGLARGAVADITIIEPSREYTYTKDSIESKSRNSPFIGWKLKGGVSHVFVAGKMVVKDGVVI